LIKKVTIITPPENEGIILESLGKNGVIQLKDVTDLDFEWFQSSKGEGYNYKELYQKIHPKYISFLEKNESEIKFIPLTKEEYNLFSANPELEVNKVLDKYEKLISEYEENLENQKITRTNIIEQKNDELKKFDNELNTRRVRLESVRALEPEELKNCFAVGVVNNNIIPRFKEYLLRYPDLQYKAVSISNEESILFVFGSENERQWVESLFLVFGVKDIFEVIDTKDILLVLDPKKREDVIKKYQEEVDHFNTNIETTSEKREQIENQYNKQLKDLEEEDLDKNEEKRGELTEILGKISYIDYMLNIISDERIPIMRTRVLSILQGWIPEDKLEKFKENVSEVEANIGSRLFVQYEEVDHHDHNVPNPVPKLEPEILQPAWTLTSLRGWPSTHEINPKYISILVFSFQFGLMYGDIGQGAIFLLAGLFLSKRFKTGMISKFATLFIPMGIFAIIFGIGYDSIFLIEHFITEEILIHTLHLPHIEVHHIHKAVINLGFTEIYYPIMPNPVHETTTLMKLVFMIGAIEIALGGVIGAINQWKAGHKWGILGQHGLGLILYIMGLYFSAMEFIRTGDFMGTLFNYWGFLLLLAGLIISMIEPIIAAFSHGKINFEVVGEGVGALLMVFVEGLANLFSFLRIVAFALAHASLANAAKQLGTLMGIAPSLILMNLIAMSFEFMSSGVQSLRLLYYEFMSKFYHGDGLQFIPFRVRKKTK
jgi:V/A-type H+-transporting ATPase subunit I